MFLPTILLYTVATLVAGSGYDAGYQDGKDHENHCKKVKHHDIDPPVNYFMNKKAKFTHLERNRKFYTTINCPSDSFPYVLIAEHFESVFNIFGSKFPDTAVLAAGFDVGVVAKCDSKRITVRTTDGKKINIKKVACLQYNAPSTTTTTYIHSTVLPACMTCKPSKFMPPYEAEGTEILFTNSQNLDGCLETRVKCKSTSGPSGPCTQLALKISGMFEDQYDTRGPLTSVTDTFPCEADGMYSNNTYIGISQFSCVWKC